MKLNSIKSYRRPFLNAASLGEKPKTVTVSSYEVTVFNSTEKLVLNFNELDEGLVLNQTNAVTLGNAFGDEVDNWVGKSITLWTEQIQFKGESINSIKVKPATKDEAHAGAQSPVGITAESNRKN